MAWGRTSFAGRHCQRVLLYALCGAIMYVSLFGVRRMTVLLHCSGESVAGQPVIMSVQPEWHGWVQAAWDHTIEITEHTTNGAHEVVWRRVVVPYVLDAMGAPRGRDRTLPKRSSLDLDWFVLIPGNDGGERRFSARVVWWDFGFIRRTYCAREARVSVRQPTEREAEAFSALTQVIDPQKLCASTSPTEAEVEGLTAYLARERDPTARQYALHAASLCPPFRVDETPGQYNERVLALMDELSGLPGANGILRLTALRRAEGFRHESKARQ